MRNLVHVNNSSREGSGRFQGQELQPNFQHHGELWIPGSFPVAQKTFSGRFIHSLVGHTHREDLLILWL